MSNQIVYTYRFYIFDFPKRQVFVVFPIPVCPTFYLDDVVRMPPTLVGFDRFVFRSNIPKTFTDLRAMYGVLR